RCSAGGSTSQRSELYATQRRGSSSRVFHPRTAVLAGCRNAHYAHDMTDVAAAPGATAREVRRMTSYGVPPTLRRLGPLPGGRALQLSEISRELGLPKSTIHRVCSILVERAWAVREDDGRYSLGVRALALGSRAGELPIVVGFRTVAAELLTKH